MKDSISTASYSIDLRLINARFASYTNWAPPPSCLPDIMNVTFSPRPSPPFMHTASDQKLEAGTAWKLGYMGSFILTTLLTYLLVLPAILLHRFSSLPSVQSRFPSQRSEELMHVPLLHRNAPLWQETVQIVAMFRYSYWS